MVYPEKVTDLKPDQLVSDPVVFIDYDLFPGLPAEAQEAPLKAVSAFESFSDSPAPHEQIVAYRRPLVGEEPDRAIRENKPLIDMAEDSILIRAERLVRGDIVLWANATWRVRLKEPVSLSEFEIVLERVQGDDDRGENLRTTVGRDRKFRVLPQV